MLSTIQSVDWLLHGETFLRWWLSEFTNLFPSRWKDLYALDEEPVLQVTYHPRDTIGLDQPCESCHQLTADASEGLLALGPGTFYVRRLDLPHLASKSLTKAVQFEALRFNPLSRSLSSFDYAVVARDLVARRVQIDLFVVRQRALDTAISFARSNGITLLGACADSGGMRLRLPRLLTRHRRTIALSIRQRRLLRRVSVSAATAIALMTLLVVRVEFAADTLRTRAESLGLAAHAGDPERQQLRELILEVDDLNDEQKKSSVIGLLAELTRLLPDTVWLTHLTISSAGVHVQGLAQRSSALIGTLSKSNLIRQVHFAGPIIKDPRQDLEQFELDFTVNGKTGR